MMNSTRMTAKLIVNIGAGNAGAVEVERDGVRTKLLTVSGIHIDDRGNATISMWGREVDGVLHMLITATIESMLGRKLPTSLEISPMSIRWMISSCKTSVELGKSSWVEAGLAHIGGLAQRYVDEIQAAIHFPGMVSTVGIGVAYLDLVDAFGAPRRS